MPQRDFYDVFSRDSLRSDVLRSAPAAENLPTFGDAFQSGAELFNLPTSMYLANYFRGRKPLAVKGYNYFRDEDQTGYEDAGEHFLGSQSPEETRLIRAQIDLQRGNRRTLERAGWLGTGAAIAAGFASPENFIPIGGAIQTFRAAGVGVSIARGAGRVGAIAGSTALVSESLLQTADVEKSQEEILISTLFASLLGSGLGATGRAFRIGRLDFLDSASRTLTEMDARLGNLLERSDSTLGKVSDYSALSPQARRAKLSQALVELAESDPDIAKVAIPKTALGKAYARGVNLLSVGPGWRLSLSDIPESRLFATAATDQPILRQGETLGPAIESQIIRRQGAGALVVGEVQTLWSKFRKERKGTEITNEVDFYSFVGKALRRDEKATTLGLVEPAAIEMVEEGARFVRGYFNLLQDFAVETGLLSKTHLEGALKGTAPTWLHRMYNAEAIILDEAGPKRFRAVLVSHFKTKKTSLAKAERKAQDTIDNILGTQRGRTTWEVVSEAGPFKDRVLLIADDLIEEWLESDVTKVIFRLTNTIVPEAEMASAFAPAISGRLGGLLRRVRGAAEAARLGDPDELTLAAQRGNDLEAVAALNRDFAASSRALAKQLEQHMVRREALFRRSNTLNRRADAETDVTKRADLRTRANNARDEALVVDADAEVIRQKVKDDGINNNQRPDLPKRIDLAPGKELEARIGRVEGAASDLRRDNARLGVSLDHIKTAVRRRAAKMAEGKSVKEAVKIRKRAERDIVDIERLRLRMLNQAGIPNDPSSFGYRIGKAARQVNFMRFMGGVTPSSFPDVGNMVAVNGMERVTQTFWKVMQNPVRELMNNPEEVTRMLSALELVAPNSRAKTLAELYNAPGDFTTVSRVEQGLEFLTEQFAKATGIDPYNAIMKMMSSMMSADRIIGDSIKLVDGKVLSRSARQNLQLAGINLDIAKAIVREFRSKLRTTGEQIGQMDGGLHLGRSQLWSDMNARDLFQAAVIQDVRRTVVTPSAGDLPLFMDAQMGKIIFQFKSFAISAQNKILVSGLQRADAAVLQGFTSAVVVGALITQLKLALAGRDFITDPLQLATNAVDRSGILGLLPEYNNVIERLTYGRIGINPLLGTPGAERYRPRNMTDVVFGPSLGATEDVLQLTRALFSEGFTEGDVSRARRLTPAQNLFYLQNLFNAFEVGLQEGLPRTRIN